MRSARRASEGVDYPIIARRAPGDQVQGHLVLVSPDAGEQGRGSFVALGALTGLEPRVDRRTHDRVDELDRLRAQDVRPVERRYGWRRLLRLELCQPSRRLERGPVPQHRYRVGQPLSRRAESAQP